MDQAQYCPGCMEALAETGECRHCSFNEAEYEAKLGNNRSTLLPLGTMLAEDRYLVGRVLGFGGFSITCIGRDMKNNLRVAIKEFMPRALCHRIAGSLEVAPYGEDDALSFEYGLEQFLKEARILGNFDQHKGMVKVHNYFYANGTGYLIMDYLQGATLKEYLQALGRPMTWDEALVFLLPVADILEGLHHAGLIHRDISPDNIFVGFDGEMKLFDFGAARLALGEYTKSLPVVLKAGYTPLEQYSGRGNQGPWTDLYALASTLFHLVSGQQFPAATDRVSTDLVPGLVYEQAAIPLEMKPILLKATAVKVESRYQSITEFKQDIHRGRITEPGEFALDEEGIASAIKDARSGGADDDGYEFVGGVMRKKTAAAVDQEFLQVQNTALDREYARYQKKLRHKRIRMAIGVGLGLAGLCALYIYYRLYPARFADFLSIFT